MYKNAQPWRLLVLLAVTLVMSVGVASADTLKLRDGSTLEGTVIKRGKDYWIKTTDGASRLVPAGDVVELITGSSGSRSDSEKFTIAKRRADVVESPMAAIAIWQQFLDSKPDPVDEAAARKEMEKWQKLADDEAEKIFGRWVGGEERKQLVGKADALLDEAWDLMQRNQTLAAIKKLEEAARIYPNSFRAHFLLGILAGSAQRVDDAIRYFETCLRLKPASPEALNNLGVMLAFKGEYERSINTLHKAAEVIDTPEIAQNLLNAVHGAPPLTRQKPQLKNAVDSSRLLALKYGLKGPGNWLPMGIRPEVAKTHEELPAGVTGSGTGFIIHPDGLIVTNRHVVQNSRGLLVVLPSNERYSAEIIAVDQTDDLALIRIKAKEQLVLAQFSPKESPALGADCVALGYPLLSQLGSTLKNTRGSVTSVIPADAGPDILIDAKVNPGNSGGPLVDRHGHVMGIVSMKSRSNELVESYGMAISAGRVRKFLEKNNVNVQPAGPDAARLDPEDVVAKVGPATVCIIATE